jgi:hypothetical protein
VKYIGTFIAIAAACNAVIAQYIDNDGDAYIIIDEEALEIRIALNLFRLAPSAQSPSHCVP